MPSLPDTLIPKAETDHGRHRARILRVDELPRSIKRVCHSICGHFERLLIDGRPNGVQRQEVRVVRQSLCAFSPRVGSSYRAS